MFVGHSREKCQEMEKSIGKNKSKFAWFFKLLSRTLMHTSKRELKNEYRNKEFNKHTLHLRNKVVCDSVRLSVCMELTFCRRARGPTVPRCT